jgi:methenyltetrahydrofolate cyclohydrolase
MAIADKSCSDFVKALSSKSSVPGGGSAAALVGSIGMALSNMTGNLTVGKKKYIEYEQELNELIDKGMKIQNKMLELMQKDADAFESFLTVYKMPANTEEEKSLKIKNLGSESIKASKVPLEIMKKAYEGIKIHKRMGEIGNVLLLSDIGCGVTFLKAALIAGKLNVLINLNAAVDNTAAEKIKKEVEQIASDGCRLADETLEFVLEKII